MSRYRIAAGSKRKAADADVAALRPIVTGRRNSEGWDPCEPEFESPCRENLQKGCSALDSAEIQLAHLSNGEAECGCETPKAEEHKIPKILSCPPPPKKPKPAARKTIKAGAASFFVPPDLNSIFLPQNFSGQVS